MSCTCNNSSAVSVFVNIMKGLRIIRTGREAYKIWDTERFRACVNIISCLAGAAELGAKWYESDKSVTDKSKQSEKDETSIKTFTTACNTLSISTDLLSTCMKEVGSGDFNLKTVGKVFFKVIPNLIAINAELLQEEVYSEQTGVVLDLLGGAAVISILSFDKEECSDACTEVSVFFEQLSDIFKEISQYFKRLADNKLTPTDSDRNIIRNAELLNRSLLAHGQNIRNQPRETPEQELESVRTSLRDLKELGREIDRLINLSVVSYEELLPEDIVRIKEFKRYICPIKCRVPRFPVMPKTPDNYLGVIPCYHKTSLITALENNRRNGTQTPPPNWPSGIAFTAENIVDVGFVWNVIVVNLKEFKKSNQKNIEVKEGFLKALSRGIEVIQQANRINGNTSFSASSSNATSQSAPAVISNSSSTTTTATASSSSSTFTTSSSVVDSSQEAQVTSSTSSSHARRCGCVIL